MFTAYICKNKVNETIFDIKLPLNKLNEAIDYYNLTETGNVKEYWDNNVNIIFYENNNHNFHYIKDINISYDSKKNILIQEYVKKECFSYQFSKVDMEETYQLYENIDDIIEIRLKKYKAYFTIDFTSNDLNNIKNVNIFYI